MQDSWREGGEGGKEGWKGYGREVGGGGEVGEVRGRIPRRGIRMNHGGPSMRRVLSLCYSIEAMER